MLPINNNIIISCAADGTLYKNDLTASSSQEEHLYSSENLMHMFTYDIEQPQVIYTAEESGDIHRLDLRTHQAEKIFHNYRKISSRHVESYAVKSLAQNPLYGSTQLLVGGRGFTIGLLDLRSLATSERELFRHHSERSKYLRCYGPQFYSAATKKPCVNSNIYYYDSCRRSSGGSTSEGVSISGLQVSSTGSQILASYQGDQIYTFNWHGETLKEHMTKNRGVESEFRSPPELGQDVNLLEGVGASALYGGHINYATFLKTVAFFGPNDDYVVSGSDSGHIWIWDARSGNITRDQMNENLGTQI
jgi:WD40 repeat protein